MYLREPVLEDEKEIIEYANEFKNIEDSDGTNLLYRSIKEHDYLYWLNNIQKNNTKTYLLINELEKIVGIVNLRTKLNFYLERCGGHVGYNIRPSERGKGYSKEALELILEKAYENGLNEVLLDCYNDNILSDKTIQSSGAQFYLEDFIPEKNKIVKRYKLNLEEKFNTKNNIR